LLEGKEEPSRKRNQQLSEEIPRNPDAKRTKIGREESMVEVLPHQVTGEQDKPEEPNSSLKWTNGLVPLYHGSTEMVQPEERKHMLMHKHFCKRRYCKYHNTA